MFPNQFAFFFKMLYSKSLFSSIHFRTSNFSYFPCASKSISRELQFSFLLFSPVSTTLCASYFWLSPVSTMLCASYILARHLNNNVYQYVNYELYVDTHVHHNLKLVVQLSHLLGVSNQECKHL